jgi:hypothetical protein
MKARYQHLFSTLGVLLAVLALGMGAFVAAISVTQVQAAPDLCPDEAGFVKVLLVNSQSSASGYDGGYAVKENVIATQYNRSSQASDSGYTALILAKQASYVSGYAAKELSFARQAGLVKTTKLDAYRSSFSMDAGFSALYNPLAMQVSAICYLPPSR